jgi:hypothetical protein
LRTGNRPPLVAEIPFATVSLHVPCPLSPVPARHRCRPEPTARPESDPNESTIAGEAADGDTNAGARSSPDPAASTVVSPVDNAAGQPAGQDPPTYGVRDTVGDLGVEIDSRICFDITPSGATNAA